MRLWNPDLPATDTLALEKFQSFNQHGDPRDLEGAVGEMRRILTELPTDQPEYNGILSNFSAILSSRYRYLRDVKDLDESLQLAERAATTTSVNHENFLIYQSMYAHRLRERYEARKEIADLNKAVQVSREVVERTPIDHQFIVSHIRHLSVTLAIRFESLGDPRDLAEAITLGEKALEATPKTSPEHAAMTHNLANMYEDLFKSNGLAEEENKAIDAAEAAVLATSRTDPRLPVSLTLLGHNLWRRYERTGRAEDLERAIDSLEQAVASSLSRDKALASRLNSLSAMLYTRYERVSDTQDSQGNLGRAIVALEDALELAQKSGTDLTMYQSNLSALLVNRFKINKDENDLKSAVRYGEQALERPDASHYNNLGLIVQQLYLRTGNRQELEKAIDYAVASVNSTPSNHRDLSGRLNNLGSMLLSLSSSRSNALNQFVRSWNNTRGIPLHRVNAARSALPLLIESNRWEEASIISKEAVGLLPVMNNRTLSREDQEMVASKFAGLVSEACSISLHAGSDAAEALKLLERGRGSIMGLLVDDRSDTTQLESEHPQLAEKYYTLRLEANKTSEQHLTVDQGRRRIGERIDLVASLSSCVNEIRKLPGYQRFLLGQTSQQLMELAVEGPIVIVNVSDFRSDAIIVSVSSITSIELPKLTVNWVRQWNGQSQSKVVDPLAKANVHREFLTQLWNTCVEVILEHLKPQRDTKGKPSTRVWWMGSGYACSLPFHAAGYHIRGSTKNTASQVISSYTTTLKSLAYARARSQNLGSRRSAQQTHNLMVAIMPETPGQNPLPGTVQEKEVVLKVTEFVASNVGLTQPNAKTVLYHLERCEIAHFACHGISETASPLASYLALYDSSSQVPKVDKLTVDQICKAQLKDVQIAYLSACSTAENKVQELNDEAIHLASGFQVAGFSHVIASLWSADDRVCVDVARRFYEALALEPGFNPSDRAIAVALHRSVEAVRSNNTLKWAPFIHIGA